VSEEFGTQLVRLEEQLKSVVAGLEHDRKDREHRDRQIEIILKSMNSLDRRLELVERQLAENTPSIKEFLVMKHQIEGAGLMGKWIWGAAGALLGTIISAKELWKAWFPF